MLCFRSALNRSWNVLGSCRRGDRYFELWQSSKFQNVDMFTVNMKMLKGACGVLRNWHCTTKSTKPLGYSITCEAREQHRKYNQRDAEMVPSLRLSYANSWDEISLRILLLADNRKCGDSSPWCFSWQQTQWHKGRCCERSYRMVTKKHQQLQRKTLLGLDGLQVVRINPESSLRCPKKQTVFWNESHWGGGGQTRSGTLHLTTR